MDLKYINYIYNDIMELKNIPADIFFNYIHKTNKIILVKDPKHSIDYYHYTLWLIDQNIKNILYLKKEHITDIISFISSIKNKNLFDNEKLYITYPPTRNSFHLHIVPQNYISYRPKEELYSLEEILDNFKNIEKINDINNQAQHLGLKFNVGVLIVYNINEIKNIKNIIKEKI